jgi:hypothetical protein
MLSSVYGLAASDDPAFRDVDPNNRFFWRSNRQRLSAEAIRDALLHVAGNLDTKVGGESMALDDEKNLRRTLYGEVSRFQPNEYLQTFDFPSPSLTAERRFSTNVPVQSLYFMNSAFVERQAEALVRRLAKATAEASIAEDGDGASASNGAASSAVASAGRPRTGRAAAADSAKAKEDPPERFDDRKMLEMAYPLLYARGATEQEVELGLVFLTEQRASWLEQLQKEEAEAADAAKRDATPKAADAVQGSQATDAVQGGEATAAAEGGQATAAAEAADQLAAALLVRRASMKAWVQYARALFSAAEFRYID